MPLAVALLSAEGRSLRATPLVLDGPRVVIGRSPGSDVRVPDVSVSARHATLRASGNEYALLDEGSTNGTWVDGQRLPAQTPHPVKGTERIRVGRVWLELSPSAGPATPDPSGTARELARSFVEHAYEGEAERPPLRVVVVAGADAGVELALRDEGRPYVFGSGASADVVLADPGVAAEHVVLTRHGSDLHVRAIGGRRPTALGDSWLAEGEVIVWRDLSTHRAGAVRANDALRVGDTLLVWEDPIGAALALLEGRPDELFTDVGGLQPPGAAGAAPHESARADSETKPVAGAGGPDASIASIAELAHPIGPARSARERLQWTVMEVAAILLAVVVLGASLAGLVWVLRD